jgi:hypothetical protein
MQAGLGSRGCRHRDAPSASVEPVSAHVRTGLWQDANESENRRPETRARNSRIRGLSCRNVASEIEIRGPNLAEMSWVFAHGGSTARRPFQTENRSSLAGVDICPCVSRDKKKRSGGDLFHGRTQRWRPRLLARPCSNVRDGSWTGCKQEHVALSASTLVAMEQTANFREGNDSSGRRRLHGTRRRVGERGRPGSRKCSFPSKARKLREAAAQPKRTSAKRSQGGRKTG